MRLPDVLCHLAPALGIPPMDPRPDGAGGFRVGDLVVLLIPRPDAERAFVARTRLGRISEPDATPVMAQLLRGNLFADGVGGAALSLDAQGEVFLTQYFAESGLRFESVLDALKRFVAQAQRFQSVLQPSSFSPCRDSPPLGLLAIA